MKIKHLFYLLLTLPLAFAACEKTPEPQPAQSTLTLKPIRQTNKMNFGKQRLAHTSNNKATNPLMGWWFF